MLSRIGTVFGVIFDIIFDVLFHVIFYLLFDDLFRVVFYMFLEVKFFNWEGHKIHLNSIHLKPKKHNTCLQR